ncbi:Polysaccharide pyruvyl transferase family protein WcaK [Ruegeria halocynthiae]|uniref:Polysaccharide pyruvyl transferase family protein WcaK n=1 Tax=Ruegeria halocynthiae TaxID=985054 RepID=A0A1H3B661_9RHOB|nr:polysaccharide pyruvyl transferase family protein [Ruegeria halocynthiae]SDX36549.1 Polysaccharide pyruvyl transferase family protein WcaK [Ruegeria halocynthiae]
MKLIVTGVTRTGNLGGTAMLCAVQDVLLPHLTRFQLASILPTKDAAVAHTVDKAEIVAADYRTLMLVAAPFCLLFWPFRRFRLVKEIAKQVPVLKHFSDIDAVADLSGVAFIDGRGFPLLAYNVAVTLPGLFFGKPVHKLSQAMGPFNNPVNRFAAKWVLRKCTKVIARGEISLAHLHQLGLQKCEYVPDTSFALDVQPDLKLRARQEIARHLRRDKGERMVMISPSAVVQKYCESVGKDLVEILSEVVKTLHDRGIHCTLLPHSTDTGIAKNDDLKIVTAIKDHVAANHSLNIAVLDAQGDPRWARALVAQADAFIACRFHSMIAALSQAVPVVIVGWSHKYQEAAAPFKAGQMSLDYSELSTDSLCEHLLGLLDRQDDLKLMMSEVAQDCYDRSAVSIASILKAEKL